MSEDPATDSTRRPGGAQPAEQPEPDASSDGDGSWTDDPQTQDPDEDRSVEAVVRRTARSSTGDADGSQRP